MMKLDEIAALAGVSRTTASYVINGKADQYRISQATRDKVMAVVTAHNYQPDSRAATLRGGPPKTLGFILPDTPDTPSWPNGWNRGRGHRAISCSSSARKMIPPPKKSWPRCW